MLAHYESVVQGKGLEEDVHCQDIKIKYEIQINIQYFHIVPELFPKVIY